VRRGVVVMKMIGGAGGETAPASLHIDQMEWFVGPARMSSPMSDCTSAVEPQQYAESHGSWIGWS
jgi:hypothetical protein